MTKTSHYEVLNIKTGEVALRADIHTCMRFCAQFRGHYFRPFWF